MRSVIFAASILGIGLFAILPASAISQEQNATQDSPDQSSATSKKPLRIRIGGDVMQAKLIKEVDPRYPQEAEDANVTGTVILHAIIGTNGKIQDLKLMAGPPMLIQSAMNAVRQWEYAPVLLNGEPVEVDTTISVKFCFECGTTPPSSPGASGTPSAATSSSSSSSAKKAGAESTQASGAQSATTPAIDPQLRADILHLFEVMHYQEIAQKAVRDAFDPLRDTVRSSLPDTPNREHILDSYVEALASLLNSPDGLDRAVAIYAKYLSDSDVQSMIQFYSTPAGQHLNAVQNQLISEMGEMGKKLASDHIPQILQDLCKQYPELRGKVDFCPGETEKQGLLQDSGIFSKVSAKR